MSQTAGLAKTQIDIVDISLLVATGLKGITGVLGVTDLGIHATPKLVGSWLEYVRNFGGLRADSIFPLLCRRALEAGAKLKVSRAGHYTLITDKTTVAGTKASGIITATTTVSVSIASNKFVVAGEDVTQYFTAGVTFSVDGSIGTTAYTVTSSALVGSDTQITATIPAAEPGTMTYINKKVTLKAEAVGTGYNKVSMTIVAAANGVANQVDISIDHSDYPYLKQTVKNFPQVPTSNDITNFNNNNLYADIFSIAFVGALPIGTVTLSAGAEDVSLVVTADYIGDASSAVGINSFDADTEITRIAIPEKAVNAIDVALVNYAAARKDIRAVVRCPIGISGSSMVDYRECTGVYSGTAIDSMYGSMTGGGLSVIDPLSQNQMTIPEIGDVIGLMSNKDSKQFEWFAAAGSKRGRILNALGVDYNLGTPARATEGDNVDAHGINAVIQHPSFGIVRWGNSSLSKANSLLKHENVCELLVFLYRAIKPLCDSELFDPNDTQTWQNIYRKVKMLMDYVAVNRGVYGGEGKGWKYDGDQDVDNVQNAIINQPVDIAAGKYKFNLFVKPTPAMKYVGVTVAVTNSDVSFEAFTASDTLG